MSIKWPKKWETNEAKNCHYFCIPGYLQIKYDRDCHRNGISVHKDLTNMIIKRCGELEDKDSLLNELEKDFIELEQKWDQIKNHSAMIMANEDLTKKVDGFIRDMALQNKTYQNIYLFIKNLAAKNFLTFNEMLEIFCKRTEEIHNQEIRKKLLFSLTFVGDHANNGTVTDAELNETFPKPVRE